MGYDLEKIWMGASEGIKLNISTATYRQIECCKYYPSEERQEKIAKILGKSVGNLFPEWLRIFSKEWKNSEKSKIVPVNELRLNSPEILALPSGD